MKRERQGRQTVQLIKSVLIGFVASLIVMAAGCAIAAALIHTEKLPESAIRYCAWTICAVSALAGCGLARALAQRAALPVCMSCAVLLLCAMIIIRTAFHFQGSAAWLSAAVILAAALSASLRNRSRRKRRR